MSKLRILFCASEVTPYAKTGGLADVTGSVPAVLRQLGCDVRIFMPLYRPVRDTVESLTPLAENIPIAVGGREYHVHLWQTLTASGMPVYFLEKDEFFDRPYLYGSPTRGDYEDNAERFITFCRAVYELCLHLNWFPEIFHLHDWQTALIAAFCRLQWCYEPNFAHSGTVFTIHNLAYQGLFPGGLFPLTRLPEAAFSMPGLEFWGQCNFLKAGLVYSDFLTTVSPRYSREIQQAQNGHGLEGVLRERSSRLAGILNGVDYQVWNPASDRHIPARYDTGDLAGKRHCKTRLLSELGFPEEASERPLLGMISRLAAQKGFDLVGAILEQLLELPLSLVILGTGDAAIERKLRDMAVRHPTRLKLLFRFDETMAHRIEAGADLFLMPSHFEPCGLNQLYSLRYGTLPVVHATGGLDDSVVDVLQHPYSGTGFKFYDYQPGPFLYVIRAALEVYRDAERWQEIQQRAMTRDFSWDRSAGDYLRVYREVMAQKAVKSV